MRLAQAGLRDRVAVTLLHSLWVRTNKEGPQKGHAMTAEQQLGTIDSPASF
jgi:hypothetical protein